MKITTTEFDTNYLHATVQKSVPAGRYVLHTVTVNNTIMLDDSENAVALVATYSTACSYDFNDYSSPCPDLELDDLNETLTIIDSLYEHEFDDKEFIDEKLDDVKELCPIISTVDRLRAVYAALNDNLPVLEHYVDFDEYSNDPDDYELDNTCEWVRKSA